MLTTNHAKKGILVFMTWVSWFIQTTEYSIAQTRPSFDYGADEFIGQSYGEQLGPREYRLTLTIRNPTQEPICIYDAILLLTDVVLPSHPDRKMRAFESDPADAAIFYESGEATSEVEHALVEQVDGTFAPVLQLSAGESYSFTQNRSFEDFVMLYGLATDGAGYDLSPAPPTEYQMLIRGLQIFRCDALTNRVHRQIAQNALALTRVGLKPITETQPSGIYWQFDNVLVGDPFRLAFPNAPDGSNLMYVDTF